MRFLCEGVEVERSDAVVQEIVVVSVLCIFVERAYTLCDEALQHCLDYFGFHHPDI